MTALPLSNDTSRSTLWRVAFALILLLPLAIIFRRGLADGIVVLVGLLFLAESARRREWRWLSDPAVRMALIAWAWMVLVVSPLAYDPLQSMGVALSWIRFVLFYAALRYWVLRPRESLLWIGYSLFFLLMAVTADTLWQYATGMSLSGHAMLDSGRLTGPMDNVKVGLFLSRLMVPVLGLWVWLAAARSRMAVGVLGLCVLLLVVAVLLSGERTAFFSMLLALFTIGGVRIWQVPSQRKYYIAALLFVMLCIALLYQTQPWVRERAQALTDVLRNFSTTSYGQLFWTGYTLGKEYWVTGTGFKGFRELCLGFLASGTVNHCNLHPHNPYIEWFAEAGAFGFLLFVGMVGAFFAMALRALCRHGSVLAAAAAATCVMHFFPLMATQSFFSNWPAIVLWYSLGLAFAALNYDDGPGNRAG